MKYISRTTQKICFFFLVITTFVGIGALASKALFFLEHKKAIVAIENKKEEVAKINFYIPKAQKEEKTKVAVKPLLSRIDIFWKNLPTKTPLQLRLKVPFICQNPFQNKAGWKWHKESCEEAATMQAMLFLEGKTMTAQQAHDEIMAMIAWQKKELGGHHDLYAEDMRGFIRDYYALSDDGVLFLPRIDRSLLQKILTAGYPVIAPAEGAALNNPFYPYPGYHMLTVVGYTPTQIITNDVGTKRGESYPYSDDIFFAANSESGGGGFVILETREK